MKKVVTFLALIVLLFNLNHLVFGNQLVSASEPEQEFAVRLSSSVSAKISPDLQYELQQKEATQFFIILTTQANLDQAVELPTKGAKGAYVYKTLWDTAQVNQAPLIKWLQARDVPYRSFYIVNSLLIEGDLALATTLAARPDVAHLESNPQILTQPARIQLPKKIQPTSKAIESNITYLNADRVWQMGFTGQNIVIGGQDTGYSWDHLALVNHYRGWNGQTADHNYNWHDSIHVNTHGTNTCGVDSNLPCDDYGHGTHTMGTAVGDDEQGNQIGMAPGAKWMGCRNMDNGWGSPASYLECFEFFLAPYPLNETPETGKPELAPDITINSWSCPDSEGCTWQTLQSAVEAHEAAGIMTVVAAGNAGPACGSISEPASIYEAAYTVGALVKGSDTLASFSGRGPVNIDGSDRLKPDIVAPGTSIRSSVPGGGYNNSQGTSMAAPHVVGGIALLWSAVPTLTNNLTTTKSILNQTTQPITSNNCSNSDYPNNLYGFGRLDILAAVKMAQNQFNVPPTAQFVYNEPVYINKPVIFTSAIGGAWPITTTWHFGDQHSATMVITLTDTITQQHIYTQAGSYQATLTATNKFGQAIFSQTISVYQVGTGLFPPQAKFTYTTPVYQNQAITFTNLSTGTTPLTTTWHFGDGSQITNFGSMFLPVTHTYPQIGQYTVTLTVTNILRNSIFRDIIDVKSAISLYLPLIVK